MKFEITSGHLTVTHSDDNEYINKLIALISNTEGVTYESVYRAVCQLIEEE